MEIEQNEEAKRRKGFSNLILKEGIHRVLYIF